MDISVGMTMCFPVTDWTVTLNGKACKILYFSSYKHYVSPSLNTMTSPACWWLPATTPFVPIEDINLRTVYKYIVSFF